MADMADPEPSFARNAAAAAYYERGAEEYDDWYLGVGQHHEYHRPDYQAELARLVRMISALAPARTLDVACGTGFFSRHVRGVVVGVDRSPSMARLARSRIPGSRAVLGDALRLPFADGSFERVLTGHFYGHLGRDEREAFLSEAARVADELIVLDAALRPELVPELWEERRLEDGSRHRIYKRYFTAEQLADEIDGETLMAGDWFVAARASLPGTGLHRKSGTVDLGGRG
jgi:SAM-dependent methyltransferase